MIVRKTVYLKPKWNLDHFTPVLLVLVLLPYAMTILYQESHIPHIQHQLWNMHAIELRPPTSHPHDTTSQPWTNQTELELEWVQEAFETHLLNGPHLCLCMHHLQLVNKTQYRVCATYLRGTHDTLVMINPAPKIMSQDVTVYREQSIACGNATFRKRKRANTYGLEWTTPRNTRVSGIFYGARAACFQLAMEEIEGRVPCE